MPVLIIAIVFSVPLAAIVGSFWVRVKRMEFEAGGRDQEPRMRALEAENRELRQRIETLETIVTVDDPRGARTRVRVAAAGAEADVHEVAAEGSQGARRRGVT